MYEVELISPNRMNIGGVVYLKGVKKPVAKEVALTVGLRANFRVYGLTPEEMKAHRDDEIRPRGVDLGEAIRDAIAQLEVPDPENYNRDGLPALHALSDFLGYQVTAAQRDAAMAHEDEKEPPAAAPTPPAPAAVEAPARKGGVRFTKPVPAEAEQKVPV
jgi:hypothetical protein